MTNEADRLADVRGRRKERKMRHEDIERIYTEKVAELIAAGYSINPATMSGSQGEIAHVDLKKGDEILRVLLCQNRVFEHDLKNQEFFDSDSVEMIVGRNTDDLGYRGDPFGSFRTIWNNHLEVIEKRTFYRIDCDSDYFTESRDEIKAMCEVRYARHRRDNDVSPEIDLEKASAIVLPFIRRQKECKSKKLSDIIAVKKVKRGYTVFLKNGKHFDLRGRA